MEKVFIDLGKDSYFIYIKKGLLKELNKHIGNPDKIMIISDERVDNLYGDIVEKSLENKEVYKYLIKAGEESKTFKTVEKILSKMLELGFTRNSKIINLGGGLVGDIGGFCASIYMRGISYIQVPSTLLAQVDSSVGGKTGINMLGEKNMIGSFYQPEKVLIDLDMLKSLAKREIISGLGEIIKYGIIWDYKFLNYIEEHFEDIVKLKKTTMKKIIKKSCEIKAEIVSQDEREKGIRKILNHGHTIGHGLESVTKYKKYRHGEAILIGIYYESLMAKDLNFIDDSYFNKIENIIKKTKISLDIKDISKKDLIDSMMKDKKNKEGKISFILPKGRSKVEEILLDRRNVNW